MHFTDWTWRVNVREMGGGRRRATRATFLLALAYIADMHLRAGNGPDVWIEGEEIARLTGWAWPRTVTYHLRDLTRLGLAEQLPRPGCSSLWRMPEAARRQQPAVPRIGRAS